MKKPSTDLFDLIKSMSNNEKRYFKLYSKLQTGEQKSYLLLFDILDQQENYDEDIVKQKIANSIPLEKKNQFSVIKTYLYKLILKSLRNYNDQNFIEAKLYNQLFEISLLEERGLYKQAMTQTNKLLKNAAFIENQYVQIATLRKKAVLMYDLKTPKTEEKLLTIYKEIDQILIQLKEEIRFEKAKRLFINFFLKQKKIRAQDTQLKAKINTIIPKDLFDTIQINASFRTNDFILSSRSVYYLYFKKNSEKSYKVSKDIIELWDKHPQFIKLYPNRYRMAIANLLTRCHRLRRFEEFPKYLKKIEKIKPNSFNQKAEVFQSFGLLKLIYFLNTNQFKEARQFIPELDEGLIEFQSKINKPREIQFYHNITILYFLSEDFQNANSWLNRLLDSGKDEIQKDIKQFARLLQLIIHYELDNDQVVEYMHQATYRDLLRKKQLDAFEKAILKHILKLLKAPGRIEKKAVFENLKAEITKIRNKSPKLKLVAFDEIMFWIEARIQRRTIISIIKSKKP